MTKVVIKKVLFIKLGQGEKYEKDCIVNNFSRYC